MADSLVSVLAQTILANLNSVALREIGLACGLKDELNNLQSIFGIIQLVLQDAELKQRKSEAIQSWLRKLKNVAYDTENILDKIATEGLRRRVKNIRKKLDVVAEERHKFHSPEGITEDGFGNTLDTRMTSSLVNELEICGRKEEKEMIIEKLLDSKREQHDLSVYAIWGMGGIGKTTLAQLVYNDERTTKDFALRIWVCVSDDFSIQRKVEGTKIFMVLDDVWNENHRQWDGLKEVLRCGSKGSMLIVMTRIEKVAIMMATITPHKIECLLEHDSWSLFKRRAFEGREEEENLVAIGKVIVKKCGGIPLAINALGSLMRFKSYESEWYLVRSCYDLKRLPESLTCLLNLQTLKLTNSDELLELPKGLKFMKKFWFPEMEDFSSLRCTPPGLGDLSCLHRLSIFIVGEDASHQIHQLKELNLGGKLSIQGLEKVRNLEDAKSANLMRKKNLTSLSLSWTYGVENSALYFEEVLEGLQPHKDLVKICIESY
ncbi:hypothetical protein BUALT_Bualt11G0059700 [Buddleja alternifolia]|uniref:Disease resistance protein RGA3 n=1 Tax=Buddleja alternifolia TaxID=168488 RepID=A0AAV6X3P4_9LAMI|nr:hypothetical protein BUALT_Bualt11G0059700 [Buddleja alternifolia]